MKKLSIILLLILPVLVFAQSQDQNYIKSTTYKVATTSSISNPNTEQAAVTVQYLDGLGRPIQQVAHKQSNTGKDIIVHTEYDAFGRKTHDYLPYVRSSASLNFDPDAQVNTLGFYATNNVSLTGNPHFETTTNPYSEKVLESSPLSRVFEQAAPGNPWEKTSGKTIKFDYQTNGEDEVVHFNAVTTWSSTYGLYDIQLVKYGFYDENELYKTITKDENWTSGLYNTTEEFKNKQGQVVLKRTYNVGKAHDTYYVYDIYGNLTYVLPPQVDAQATITQSILDGLCYQYKHDARNRQVEKKLPGKQWEFILYNKLDQPVATSTLYSPYGTAGQGWLITKYDAFGRVVYTGWMFYESISPYKRKELQDQLNSTTQPLFEAKTSSPNSINNIQVSYTNQAFPTDPFELLTVNYYDNYDYPNAPTPPSDIFGDNVVNKVKTLPTGTWTRFLTNENETAGELSYSYYDGKGRPIANITENHLGGFTSTRTKLDFEGKVLYTKTEHSRDPNGHYVELRDDFHYTPQGRMDVHIHQINGGTQELIAYNGYDELGQLIYKQVGGQDINNLIGLQRIDYRYNSRGWLTSINNVDDLNNSIGHFQDLFSFKINYNTVTKKNTDTNMIEEVNDSYGQTVKKLYNGNIAETYWRTSTDNVLRKYSYAYDYLNRLNDAYYQKPADAIEQTDAYNESIRYDKNGNIHRLTRTGDYDGNTYTYLIDELEYHYQQDSNLLLKVSDATNESLGFKDDSDGTNDTEDDYEYDANGNLTLDQNKAIVRINYNHLNLPTQIDFSNSSSIYYLYNAAGVKVKKIVQYGAQPQAEIIETDYLGGFQYRNQQLLFFPHPEGYVKHTMDKNENSSYDYVYNYTDHLGNIRLSYVLDPATPVLKVLEENHYYPFGLKHTNYNSGKKGIVFEELTESKMVKPVDENGYFYKYNGKELQEELGLNVYAYGWRDYDPAIGRFTKIDRFAEKYPKYTPYGYAGNSPVLINDIQGDSLWISFGKNEKALYENGKLLSQGKDGKFSEYKGNQAKLDKKGNVKGYKGILGQTVKTLNNLQTKSSFANGLITSLQDSNNNFNIRPSYTGVSGFRVDLNSPDGRVGVLNNNAYAFQVLEQGKNLVDYAPFNQIGSGGDILWNLSDGLIGLGHEIGHAFDANMGMLDSRRIEFNGGIEEIREIRGVYYENRIRQDLDMNLRQQYMDGPKLINSIGNPMYIQPPSIIFLGL